MNWLAKALATGFFLSYLPARLFKTRVGTGAGLVGTLWGVAVLPLLPHNPYQQTAVWLGVLALSIVIGDRAEELLGVKDDARIVIDETIGFLTAMLFLPHSWPAIIGAFVLFRLFDVWKPGVIRKLSQFPGGWGVVLDDIAAGVVSNLILQCLNAVHPL
jgi:phosphatidylglycerophosphatase A